MLSEYLQFNLHGILCVLSGFINLSLGLFVLSKNTSSNINRTFFLATICIFSWLFGFGMVNLVQNAEDARLWMRFSYIGGVPFAFPILYLFSFYVTKRPIHKTLLSISFALATMCAIPMIFLNHWVIDFADYSWGRFIHFPGTTFATFFIILVLTNAIVYSALCLRNFYLAWRESSSFQQKTHYQNLFFAYLIAYSSSAGFFTYLIDWPYPFGYISISIYSIILTYSIAKYRLLDIQLVIKKMTIVLAIYLGLVAIIILLTLPFIRSWDELTFNDQPIFFIISSVFAGLVLSCGPFIYAYFLKKSFWLKTHTTTSLTHELKSPLASIRNLTELTRSRLHQLYPNDEKNTEYLELIEKNIIRLETFVNDLLTISRIQDDSHKLEYSEFDVVSVIFDEIQQIRSLAISKELEFEYQGPKKFSTWADKEKIRQVFSIIITNALKFTSRGKISIKVSNSPSESRFSILDTGKGITPKDLPKIFDRFYQGHKSTKGTGIGLYIAKSWVEAHYGKIWANSTGEGRGATFCFTLPLANHA